MAKAKDPGYFQSWRLVFQKIVSEFNLHQCMILFALQHTAKGTSIGRPKVKVPGEPRRRSLLVGEGITSYARLAQDSGLSRRTIQRFLPTLVENLDWLTTQVAPRGPKEWGGIYFRLDFRKMRLWGASQGTCIVDCQTITPVVVSESVTGRPQLCTSVGDCQTITTPQLWSGSPPYETLKSEQIVPSRAPLVVAAVLGDKSLDKQARNAIRELIQGWPESNGADNHDLLGTALRYRLETDPKRCLAQVFDVGQAKSPRDIFAVLLHRLKRGWKKEPSDGKAWPFARAAMSQGKRGKGGPSSLGSILKQLGSQHTTAKTAPKTEGT